MHLNELELNIISLLRNNLSRDKMIKEILNHDNRIQCLHSNNYLMDHYEYFSDEEQSLIKNYK